MICLDRLGLSASLKGLDLHETWVGGTIGGLAGMDKLKWVDLRLTQVTTTDRNNTVAQGVERATEGRRRRLVFLLPRRTGGPACHQKSGLFEAATPPPGGSSARLADSAASLPHPLRHAPAGGTLPPFPRSPQVGGALQPLVPLTDKGVLRYLDVRHCAK